MSKRTKYGNGSSTRSLLHCLLCAILVLFTWFADAYLYYYQYADTLNQVSVNPPQQIVDERNISINTVTLAPQYNDYITDEHVQNDSMNTHTTVNLSSSEWDCLGHIDGDRPCVLFATNISIFFNRAIRKSTSRSRIISVNLTDHAHHISNRVAVMKYTQNEGWDQLCVRQGMMEYRTLDQLQASNQALHVPSLTHNHYYQYIHPQNGSIAGCVYFMTQLNTRPSTVGSVRRAFYNLMNTNKTNTISSTIHRYRFVRSILPFVLNCYDDVVSVLNMIHSIGKYYSDFHADQILIDVHTHRCYLVDFHSVHAINELHSMRSVRCYWQRCPARIYYPSWVRPVSHKKENETMLFLIKYEVFTMMLNLFVDVCGNMERLYGNDTTGQLLMNMNQLYQPWKGWTLRKNLQRFEHLFRNGYCRRQQIVAFLRNTDSFDKLQCVKPFNITLKKTFLQFLDIYEDDKQYFRSSLCSFVL
eukprot:174043_1